jgi:hypothetical protein
MSDQPDSPSRSDEPSKQKDRYDLHRISRCPQLGDSVTFGYCRTMNQSLPCARMVSCWGGIFDVEGFLQEHFDQTELAQAWASAQRGRVDIIADTLRRVLEQRRTEPGPKG